MLALIQRSTWLLLLALIFVILLTLWPLDFFPSNKVEWITPAGLHFTPSSIAFTTEPVSLVGNPEWSMTCVVVPEMSGAKRTLYHRLAKTREVMDLSNDGLSTTEQENTCPANRLRDQATFRERFWKRSATAGI